MFWLIIKSSPFVFKALIYCFKLAYKQEIFKQLVIYLAERLEDRIKKSPIEYEECLKRREEHYHINDYNPWDETDTLYPGTYYLEKIDDKWRRYYCRKEPVAKKIEVSKPRFIPIDSQKCKVFALSRM